MPASQKYLRHSPMYMSLDWCKPTALQTLYMRSGEKPLMDRPVTLARAKNLIAQKHDSILARRDPKQVFLSIPHQHLSGLDSHRAQRELVQNRTHFAQPKLVVAHAHRDLQIGISPGELIIVLIPPNRHEVRVARVSKPHHLVE